MGLLEAGSVKRADVISYLQRHAQPGWLQLWHLAGDLKTLIHSRNSRQLVAAYKDFVQSGEHAIVGDGDPLRLLQDERDRRDKEAKEADDSADDTAHAVLQLICSLGELCKGPGRLGSAALAALPEDFISAKLTTKLKQQLSDPLVLASDSLPTWCMQLTSICPALFPLEARQLFFSCTAFGVSRAIAWIQSKHESGERHSQRRDDGQEFRLGRLKHERVFVPRGDDLLSWAMNVMRVHATHKSILEIEFQGEQGTGLGPSLEFYTLVAAEVQRADLKMWICDDAALPSDTTQPRYVVRKEGLFPAPLPPGLPDFAEVIDRFRFLGVFAAKALQDSRLVALPFSRPFLKWMCGKQLGLPDIAAFAPELGEFLLQLQDIVKRKKAIEMDETLGEEERAQLIATLRVVYHGTPTALEDLCLTFVHLPSSTIYGFADHELCVGGSDRVLTLENAEEYLHLRARFVLEEGIAQQLEAFKAGFCEVFPIDKLSMFTPDEVLVTLCGELEPQWTREDLLNFTEPKYGYTRESPGYLRFINVMLKLDGSQRKAFLSFSTGCPTLPPGGLANLHPRLTIVRKTTAANENPDDGFPSVNTCVHYLKLPEYSSEEALMEKLLLALETKGFHLN